MLHIISHICTCLSLRNWSCVIEWYQSSDVTHAQFTVITLTCYLDRLSNQNHIYFQLSICVWNMEQNKKYPDLIDQSAIGKAHLREASLTTGGGGLKNLAKFTNQIQHMKHLTGCKIKRHSIGPISFK